MIKKLLKRKDKHLLKDETEGGAAFDQDLLQGAVDPVFMVEVEKIVNIVLGNLILVPT